MSSESNQSKNNFSVIEELTAYLDGELDQEQVQQVELRLGEDSAYLAEMQALQKTWDLLDDLPATEPGTSFTKTTMEMVVGEAAKSEKRRRTRGWVWPGRIAMMLAIPAFLFATAFGVIRKLQTEPDRLLIDNLSVVENHSRYDSIKCDMEFLERLSNQSLFSDPTMIDDNGDSIIDIFELEAKGLIPLESDERRSYVESLDVQKKMKLKRKFEDFQNLSDVQRQRLSEFDAQLNNSDNRVRLTSTMNAYCDWLLKMDAGQRSDLRDLPPVERIKAIKKIRDRQALDDFGNNSLANLPTQEDAEYILNWYESVLRLRERQIRSHFPAAYVQFTQDHNMRTPPEDYLRRKARQGNLHWIVYFLVRADRQFVEDLILDNRQMFVLYELLSGKAKALLAERTPDQQRELILNWVETANQSQRGISVAALKQFERSLSVSERDRLEKMSSENYVATLKRMYIERRAQRNYSEVLWEQELEKIIGSGNE